MRVGSPDERCNCEAPIFTKNGRKVVICQRCGGNKPPVQTTPSQDRRMMNGRIRKRKRT